MFLFANMYLVHGLSDTIYLFFTCYLNSVAIVSRRGNIVENNA